MAQRPKVVNGQAAVRDVLDVTLGHRPSAPAPSFETLPSVPPCFRPDPISARPGRYDATVVTACKVQICIPVSSIDAASAAAPIGGSARGYQKHSPPLAV
jgi:hypothetical protein